MAPEKGSYQGRKSRPIEEQVAGRNLPHNVDAEQSVLGALLLDYEACSGVFQILTSEDFYSPRHAKLFDIIREVYERHSTLDEVMVHEELDRKGLAEAVGGMEYLAEIAQRVPTAANAEFYAEIVHEKGILRGLVTHCNEIVQGVLESDVNARDQLDAAEQRIMDIGRQDTGRDFVQIGQVIDEHFDRLDQKDAGDSVQTGFHDLDQLTTGFHPAEFIIIAGRPSMGKTTLAMNMVERVARAGKNVAIFSLEVSTDQLIQNLLCTYSKVDAHRLRKRSLGTEEWHSLVKAASELSKMQIYVDDTPGLTPLTLKAKARRLHARVPLDFIVIDYLQLMEAGTRIESRQQEISVVSRNLKGLARELSVPIVTISQLSRSVEQREDHRPRLSDLRESGAIEQDADLVLLVYREEYYKPDKDEAKGKAEIIVAKQRNGPTGTVPLCFIGQCMRFENLAMHDDEELQPF